MEALLADIELDIQELKCVIEALSRDSNSTLCSVAKRNILQMRSRLDALLIELEKQDARPVAKQTKTPPTIPVLQKTEPTIASEIKKPAKEEKAMSIAAPSILAERIKPTGNLRHSLSLNDTFRFSRDLFDNDTERMGRVLQQIGEMSSLKAALAFLTAETNTDPENEALLDLQELVRKYFDNQ